MVFHGLTDRIERLFSIEPDKFAAMGHDRTDVTVAQRKYALYDVLLHILHLSAVEPLTNDGFYLIFGHFVFFGAIQAEKDHQSACAFGEHPYNGRCDF